MMRRLHQPLLRVRPAVPLVVAIAGFVLPVAAARAQVIWDGGAGTGNWGDGVNWSTNAVPGVGVAVQFAGTVQTTVDTQVDRTVGALTFNAGADPFTLNNNTITLTGLTNSSTSTQTINSALQLTGNTSFAANTGALALGGSIFLSNSVTNRTLTFTGSANTTVTGVIANGGTSTASAVTKTGTGTLTLSGANTYGGATTVSAGTLRATTSASALGSGLLTLGGGRLQLANDTALNFGRNTTLTASSVLESDRLTAGAGVDFTLGTLTIGAFTLTANTGSNVTSGTAGLVFGATNVTGNAGFNVGANTQLTLGALNAAAARTVTKSGAGTLVLAAPSSSWITASAVAIANGRVQLGASDALGATALTNVTVNATTAGTTAQFDLANNNQSILALTFGGTGGTSTSTNTVSTGTGTLTLGGNVTVTNTGNPLGASLTGNLSLGAATRTFNVGDSTNAPADLTVSAVISGAAGAGVTKTGTGTLVLSGLNTYTGPTLVSAGTLSVNTLANLSTASALGAPTTAANGTIKLGATTVGGTLVYTGGATSTDRVIDLAGTTGGGTLQNDGTGALTFTSTFTATGAGSKTLTLRGTNTDANTIAGAIVNNSATNRTSILKADAGTWVIAGTNTYTGTTTVNNGTLRLGSSSSLANTAVTVNANVIGATALLDLNGFNATVTSLTFGGTGGTTTSTSNVSTGAGTLTLGGNVAYVATGNPLGATLSGNVALGAATRTFTVADSTTAPTDLTVSAAVSGVGGVAKVGAGTLLLSGANSYTGATTVNAGTLRLGSSSSLANSALTVNANAAGVTALLDLNGFNATVTSLTFGGTGGTATSTSNLSTGAGTLTLGGNVATSATGNPLGSTLSGNLALGATTRTFTVANSTTAADDLTVSAAISGAGGLTKAGTGTLVLSGANTYAGPTTVNAGTLRLDSAASLPATAVTVNANAAGVTALLDLNGFNATVSSLTFGGTGGTTTSTSNLSTGAGTLTLGGNVTLTPTGNPLGATLSGNLSLGAATRTFNIGDSTGTTADLTVSAIISGAAGAGLTKTGTGTLVLSGLNTYTGPTLVSAGTLSVNTLANVSTASALGAPTTVSDGTIKLGATTVAGTLLYTGGATSTDRVIDLAGTTGGGTLQNNGTGALTFTSAFTATGAGSKTLTLRGTNTDGNTIAGAIVNNSGTNRTSILKADAGTWVIAGTNTYTGTTTVNNGTLRLGSSSSLANTAVTVNANVTGATALLDLNGFNATVSSLTFGGTGGTTTSTSNVATGAGTLTLGGNVTTSATGNPLGSTLSGNVALGAATRTFTVADSTTAPIDLTVSAAISGAGGLIKAGAGTLLLSGANSYAGATTVSAGVLRLGSATALGTTAAGTTVANTAALELTGGITLGAESLTISGIGYGSGALVNLSGSNTYGGAITLGAATTIGSTAGTLTLTGPSLTLGANALTFAGAGDIALQIALGGAAGFTKTGAGTLTLGAAANTTGTVTLSGGTLNLGGLGQTIGTLQVTADSILDFGGNATLNLTNLSISSGVVLTVANWVDAVDFFYAFNDPGAANLGRVVFTTFLPTDTKWIAYDNQVTPVPEPSTYGAMLIGAALGLVWWRRRAGSGARSRK